MKNYPCMKKYRQTWNPGPEAVLPCQLHLNFWLPITSWSHGLYSKWWQLSCKVTVLISHALSRCLRQSYSNRNITYDCWKLAPWDKSTFFLCLNVIKAINATHMPLIPQCLTIHYISQNRKHI